MADSKNPSSNPNQLNIKLPEDVAGGVYSNFQIVSHTPTEFVLDFVQVLPGMQPEIRSRVVLNPVHAKRILAALSENIRKFEAQFGEIQMQEGQAPPNFPGFSGPTGFA